MVNFDQNGVFLTPTLKISVLGAKGASRTILGSVSQKLKFHNSTKGGGLVGRHWVEFRGARTRTIDGSTIYGMAIMFKT